MRNCCSKRTWVGVLLALTLFPLAHTAVARIQTNLPPYARLMPVLIKIPVPEKPNDYFTGTGIYLYESNRVFLVTAKHVLLDITSPAQPLKNTNATLMSLSIANAQCSLSVDLQLLKSQGLMKSHPSRDVVAMCIGYLVQTQDVKYCEGVVRTGALPLFNGFKACQTFTNVLEGQDALILGFPTDLLKGGSQEVDFTKPLVRRGVISQKSHNGRYIIDSGVFGGNSGGPLLVIEHTSTGGSTWLAGMMVQFVPAETRVFAGTSFTNGVLVYSGYSVAEPIDTALELIQQFK